MIIKTPNKRFEPTRIKLGGFPLLLVARVGSTTALGLKIRRKYE